MDFTLGEQTYRIGRLNAFNQLYLVQRLLPFFGKLAETADGKTEQSISRITAAFAALSDEDSEFIITICLEAVRRKQPGGRWIPALADTTFMAGLGMNAMLILAEQVIRKNLWTFFQRIAKGSPESSTTFLGASTSFSGQPEEKNLPSRPRMIGREEFLLRPVDAGLCSYQALRDRSLSLFDVALMNEYLDVRHESEKV